MLVRILSAHSSLICSLSGFLVPNCDALWIKSFILTNNQCVKLIKFPLTGIFFMFVQLVFNWKKNRSVWHIFCTARIWKLVKLSFLNYHAFSFQYSHILACLIHLIFNLGKQLATCLFLVFSECIHTEAWAQLKFVIAVTKSNTKIFWTACYSSVSHIHSCKDCV